MKEEYCGWILSKQRQKKSQEKTEMAGFVKLNASNLHNL